MHAVAFSDEPFQIVQKFFSPGKVFIVDFYLTLEFGPLLLVLAIKEFFQIEFRQIVLQFGGLDTALVHGLLNLDLLFRFLQRRIGLRHVDLELRRFVNQRGRIQDADDIVFLHMRSFRNDMDDRRLAFHLAEQDGVSEAVDRSLLGDGDLERPALDVFRDQMVVAVTRRTEEPADGRPQSATGVAGDGPGQPDQQQAPDQPRPTPVEEARCRTARRHLPRRRRCQGFGCCAC